MSIPRSRISVWPSDRAAGLRAAATPPLAAAAIAHAREQRFARVVLDTMASQMPEAMALYRSMGFQEAVPYLPAPTPGALCLELRLR